MSLQDAFRHQADVCAAMGSAFTARLLRVTADRLTRGHSVADRLLDWQGALGAADQSVPLRLAGALHGLVLDNVAHDLAAHYPPKDAGPDDAFWSVIEKHLITQPARIHDWLDRPPQTNEVGRSAILIAVGHWLDAKFDLPIALSELGASAGLNLMWDKFALQAGSNRLGPIGSPLELQPEWRGQPPIAAAPDVIGRRGCDLTPLDPKDRQDALRLQAYVWPDQPDRLYRLRSALQLAEASVDTQDAATFLQSRLAVATPDICHLIFSTVAWQYFPPNTQARARALIEAAGARATSASPIAWFGMEGSDDAPGATLRLRLWPGNVSIDFGRADFHGRWVDWRANGAKIAA